MLTSSWAQPDEPQTICSTDPNRTEFVCVKHTLNIWTSHPKSYDSETRDKRMHVCVIYTQTHITWHLWVSKNQNPLRSTTLRILLKQRQQKQCSGWRTEKMSLQLSMLNIHAEVCSIHFFFIHHWSHGCVCVSLAAAATAESGPDVPQTWLTQSRYRLERKDGCGFLTALHKINK